MQNPVSLSLAQTLNSTRQLTRYYLKHSVGLDRQKRFTLNGYETNSIHWIVAHLAWAEDMLILDAVGNQGQKIEWFKNFKFGSTHPESNNLPPYEETVQVFDKIHNMSLDLITSLSAEQLQEPNHSDLKFGGSTSKETIIQHCIRHEGFHAGQLSLLLRMQGVARLI